MREKVVVLKIGDGSFERGFPVTLQIGEAGDRPSTEITGSLPPAAEMPLYYQRWQANYRSLGLRARLSALEVQVTNVSRSEDCQAAAQMLKARFNTWLRSEAFRSVREKWLERLQPLDSVRVLLQTDHPELQRLPWHLWDLFDRYPNAELGLSASKVDPVDPVVTPPGVKILAVLGNSDGIDVQTDLSLLEKLPEAEVTVLVSPTRKEMTDRLWGQAWDILFFAGHSATQGESHTGRMFINQTDSLTIGELKYALRKAVNRGLQLAMFNSCDGLGLARELADLQIPEIIVMREPVPDRVAQEFLQSFLADYAHGEPLYLAVRQARERLQGIEDRFPCATWLPVIFQNPAADPPTWRQLAGTPDPPAPVAEPLPLRLRTPAKRFWRSLPTIVGTSLLVAGLVVGGRYLGGLQRWELAAFDHLMRLRPVEPPDSRLLVVTVTEEDVQAQPADQRRGSLSDKALDQLLAKLEAYQPQVIGLDIFRDYPVRPEFPQLAKRMRESDRFIAICRVADLEKPAIDPPPEVSESRQGFSDVATDVDNVVRRHLLAMTDHPPTSNCNPDYALSANLALQYLHAKGYRLEFTPNHAWKFGSVQFEPLNTYLGKHQTSDEWGNQILLNYRRSPSPEDVAARVTLSEVLAGKLNPEAVKDRIVLIGTTAESFKDYLYTPYAGKGNDHYLMPGVLIQAQMVSQLVSAVLDRRLLLTTWTWGAEILWIGTWALLGGLLSWWVRSWMRLLLVSLAAGLSLFALCLLLLIQFGWWVPLVPAGLAFGFSGIGVKVAVQATSSPRKRLSVPKEVL
jgi:CHASE2 domain-containing sensor protein